MRYYVTNLIDSVNNTTLSKRDSLKKHNEILKKLNYPLLSGKTILKHNIEYFI